MATIKNYTFWNGVKLGFAIACGFFLFKVLFCFATFFFGMIFAISLPPLLM